MPSDRSATTSDSESPSVAEKNEEKKLSSVEENAGSGAPLRQLLHWVTGDRDAEARALADETLATAPRAADSNFDKDEAAVLAAAKSAVASAHGDTLATDQLVHGDTNAGSGANQNQMPLWDNASSLEPKVQDVDGDEVDKRVVGERAVMADDVARPIDVKKAERS